MITAVMALTSTGVPVPADTATYGIIAEKGDAHIQEYMTMDETEAAVRKYFRDIPIMISVARCESTFRHVLEDGSVLQGRVDPADTGVMQINKRYHEATAIKLGLNVDLLEDNMAYARYLYERQGTQPWSASAPCWNKNVAVR